MAENEKTKDKKIPMAKYKQEVLDAMAEARRISSDPDVKRYTSMEELKAVLEE